MQYKKVVLIIPVKDAKNLKTFHRRGMNLVNQNFMVGDALNDT